ncbi:MAG: NfeD family protein, partial [Fibrobacterota bacterium]
PDPELPWQAIRMRESMITVGFTALAAAVLSIAFMKWVLPKLPMREGPYLNATLANIPDTASVVAVADLVGRIAVVVSPLRPVCKVELDGQELDAISNGAMVATGESVRLVEHRQSDWLVEPVKAQA